MGRRKPARLHGLLAIDKPAGWTSRDVVNHVSGLIGERRCGHTGTLDPAATGVLLLAFGSATKTVRWLTAGRKSYIATIQFGSETSTDDAQGESTKEAAPPRLDESNRLQKALAEGVGSTILQTPPAVSALKHEGVRDLERVRRGEQVIREARPVELHEVTLLDRGADWLRVEVNCGPGFYVRAWARDLGRMLDSAAHLRDLRRTLTSGVRIDTCLSIDEVRKLDVEQRVALLRSATTALMQTIPSRVLAETMAIELSQGKRPAIGDLSVIDEQDYALLDSNGQLVCVATPKDIDGIACWRVIRGFRTAPADQSASGPYDKPTFA